MLIGGFNFKSNGLTDLYITAYVKEYGLVDKNLEISKDKHTSHPPSWIL